MRRLARIVQMVSDSARKPISESRILDLASLEGRFSAEFALKGADVLGIEGRRTNIKRAAARYSFPNLKFVQDDVRNVCREKYGEFDVVLCLGILYHLDAPDCFKLLEAIAEVCSGIAIIDTHVSFRRADIVAYKGHRYVGWKFTEYRREPTPEQTEQSTWASIGNLRSFWPTKPSLVNAIVDAGFSSVYECQYPAWNDIPSDRVALIALKGRREGVLAADFDQGILNERIDEVPKVGPAQQQQKIASVIKRQAIRIARLFKSG